MQYQRIDSLTSLRFFAAALVVIFHSRHSFGGFNLFDHFSLTQAVSMFFVLSGFILSHSHREIEGGKGLATYYTSRAARIFPLHIACMIAVMVIMKQYGATATTPQIALNSLLLQSWIPDPNIYFSINGVAWSLSVEIFFYALFPALILYAKRAWHIQLLISVAITALMLSIFENHDRNLMLWAAYISPITRLSEFTLGIATYRIFVTLKDRKLSAGTATALELITILLAAFVMWFGELNYFSTTPLAISKPVAIWFANCGGSFAFALLIITFAFQRGVLSRTLTARPIVYLGEISFSIYMTHQVVIRAFDLYQPKIAIMPIWIQFTSYYLSCILASCITYESIEKPFRTHITRLARKTIYRKPDPVAMRDI